LGTLNRKASLLVPTFQSLEHFKNRYPNRGVEEEYTSERFGAMAQGLPNAPAA
jgi:hypothetical protein